MPAPFTIKKSRCIEFCDIVNKRSLTRSFVISKFGCTLVVSNLFRSVFVNPREYINPWQIPS